MKINGRLYKNTSNTWNAEINVDTPVGVHTFESVGFVHRDMAEGAMKSQMKRLEDAFASGDFSRLNQQAPEYQGKFSPCLH